MKNRPALFVSFVIVSCVLFMVARIFGLVIANWKFLCAISFLFTGLFCVCANYLLFCHFRCIAQLSAENAEMDFTRLSLLLVHTTTAFISFFIFAFLLQINSQFVKEIDEEEMKQYLTVAFVAGTIGIGFPMMLGLISSRIRQSELDSLNTTSKTKSQ